MEANYLQLIYIRKESDYDNHKHKTIVVQLSRQKSKLFIMN